MTPGRSEWHLSLNTDLWLVETGHVTWILFSHWLIRCGMMTLSVSASSTGSQWTWVWGVWASGLGTILITTTRPWWRKCGQWCRHVITASMWRFWNNKTKYLRIKMIKFVFSMMVYFWLWRIQGQGVGMACFQKSKIHSDMEYKRHF